VIGGVAYILMAVGYSLPAVMNIEGNQRQAGETAPEQVETAASEVLPS
jgi:hypothetical protein